MINQQAGKFKSKAHQPSNSTMQKNIKYKKPKL